MRNTRKRFAPLSSHPIIEAGKKVEASKKSVDDWCDAADAVLADAD